MERRAASSLVTFALAGEFWQRDIHTLKVERLTFQLAMEYTPAQSEGAEGLQISNPERLSVCFNGAYPYTYT